MPDVRVDRAIPDAATIRDGAAGGPPLVAEGEQLRKLRAVLYPAWRVTAAHEADDGERETVVLLDGTWSGNEASLAAYAAASDPLATIDPDARFEDPMYVSFRGDEDRAASTFEAWIDRWREAPADARAGAELRSTLGLPEPFGPGSFLRVRDVTRLYLPFWVLEFAADGETALVSTRGAEPLVEGRIPERDEWLARELGGHEGFYDRFHRTDPGAGDGADPGASPPDGAGGSGSSRDDAGGGTSLDDDGTGEGGDPAERDAGQEGEAGREGDAGREGEAGHGGRDGEAVYGGDGPVQPEGADLRAEQLLEPPPDRTFADVGGLDELERTLRETVVRPLRYPERYERYGLGTTTGVLLYGPPGCGKTYVAGALAGQLGRSFLPISPTDLTSKWVGEAADNVADAFAIARANQPCLVFVDEIDAVAADRGGRMTNTERQMVNQLLAELESVDEHDVVVVAATNRLEAIDDAVLRSGRFDERVEVPAPDADARAEILRVHLREPPTADDLTLAPVVGRTAGLAGSDLALVVQRAARRAMDADEPVATEHLLAAADETTTSIPAWVEPADLGGRGTAFGAAEGSTVHQPPGVARDAAEVVSPPPDRDFGAVPGMREVKTAVRERVLDPVLDPEPYAEHGLADVDGALLYGPPGCGKTHLARAVAGEVGCRFVHLRPGDLFGAGGTRPSEAVAELFEVVRANQPCVLFVDDLDETSGRGRPPTGRHQRLLTQLSTELRAVTEAGVLVLGAAQLVGDVHDSLLNAGTFDERVEVPPPSPDTREAILRATIDERLLGPVDWPTVVGAAAGYAASDLVLVAETAGRRALRSDRAVDTETLLDALERVTSTVADWAAADRYAEEHANEDLRYIE